MQKTAKKIAAAIMAFVLAVGASAVIFNVPDLGIGAENSIYAAEGTGVKIADVSGYLGETVKIPIEMAENKGFGTFQAGVEWDKNLLEFVDFTDSGVLMGQVKSYNSLNTTDKDGNELEKYNYGFSYADFANPDKTQEENGVFAELEFKIKSGATGVISIDFSAFELLDTAYDDVTNLFAKVAGSVTVLDTLVGDVDGDGEVSEEDVAKLKVYVNDNTTEIVEINSDIDGNGEINRADVDALSEIVNPVTTTTTTSTTPTETTTSATETTTTPTETTTTPTETTETTTTPTETTTTPTNSTTSTITTTITTPTNSTTTTTVTTANTTTTTTGNTYKIPTKEPVKGDLNGDGKVTPKDVDKFEEYIKTGDISGDINGDGVVDSKDTTALKKLLDSETSPKTGDKSPWAVMLALLAGSGIFITTRKAKKQ